jgi:hypothetical protein
MSNVTRRADGYDLLLASVPAPVAGAVAVGALSSLPLFLVMAAGSVFAAGIIGLALFIVPP